MPADQYTKVKRIGKGTFGTVWLVKPRSQPTNLILKEVSMRGLPASERKATMHEVKILQALHHPYIIGYKESFVNCDALCIVMEWAAGGDLGSLISQRKRAMRPFSEPDVLRWSAQLISALAYCHHELRLLHRDLKPANVFLSSTGDVKLGDFGISKLLAFSMDMAQTQCGTPLYMSPEQCGGKAYARSADVWALGCILYELMALSPPWVDRIGAHGAAGGIRGLMRVIVSGQIDIVGLRRNYSVETCALLAALLAKDPAKRPSLRTVLTWPVLESAAKLLPQKDAAVALKTPPPTPAVGAPTSRGGPAPAPQPASGVNAGVNTAKKRGADHVAAQAIQRSLRRSFDKRRALQAVAERDSSDDEPSPARGAPTPRVVGPSIFKPPSRPPSANIGPKVAEAQLEATRRIQRSMRRSIGRRRTPPASSRQAASRQAHRPMVAPSVHEKYQQALRERAARLDAARVEAARVRARAQVAPSSREAAAEKITRSFRRSIDRKRAAAVGPKNPPNGGAPPSVPYSNAQHGGHYAQHGAQLGAHGRMAERVQRAQQAQRVAEAAAKMQAHFGHFAPSSNVRQARRDADAAAKIQHLFRNSIGKRAAGAPAQRERATPNRRAQYEPPRAQMAYQQPGRAPAGQQPAAGQQPPRFVRVMGAPPGQPRAFSAPQQKHAAPMGAARPAPRGIYVNACPSSRIDQLAQPRHVRPHAARMGHAVRAR